MISDIRPALVSTLAFTALLGLGYPLAVLAMLFAAVGPYMYFKWKKWL